MIKNRKKSTGVSGFLDPTFLEKAMQKFSEKNENLNFFTKAKNHEESSGVFGLNKSRSPR